jgi:hypothetical protein
MLHIGLNLLKGNPYTSCIDLPLKQPLQVSISKFNAINSKRSSALVSPMIDFLTPRKGYANLWKLSKQ